MKIYYIEDDEIIERDYGDSGVYNLEALERELDEEFDWWFYSEEEAKEMLDQMNEQILKEMSDSVDIQFLIKSIYNIFIFL